MVMSYFPPPPPMPRVPMSDAELVICKKKQMMAGITDKETNMKNRLERRRHAIWWKWAVRLTYFSAFMVAVPLFIKLVSLCWEWVLS